MTIQQRSVCIEVSIRWQILVYTHLRSLPPFCVAPFQVNTSVHFYNVEQYCFLVDTFPHTEFEFAHGFVCKIAHVYISLQDIGEIIL